MEQQNVAARQRVLDWVARAPTRNAYLLDFFERGAGLYRDTPNGLVLRDDALDICYASGTDADCPVLHRSMLVLTDERELAERLAAEGGKELMECQQALYLSKTPPKIAHPGVEIRDLTMDDVPFILENYHNPGAYESHVRGRIREGMVGGMVDGRLAGFAGVHQEGAMGMLEVLPQYRRRGIAEVLESEIIARQIRKGRLPYCHVLLGNAASVALQTKLGLTFDPKPLFWLG